MIILSRVKAAISESIKILRFGEGDVQTSKQYLPYGVDSKPIKEIMAAQAKTTNSEDTIVFGYLIQSEETEEGETRLYSTDDAGATQFYIKLFKTGICEIGGSADFMVRFSVLETAFNDLKDDYNDLVTKWNTFASAYVPGGPATQGLPPTAQSGSVSSADISGAKIEEIKTL